MIKKNIKTPIVLASSNDGKIKEFSNFFKSINIEIIPQDKFSIKNIEEPFITFVENALHKARYANNITNLPAIADDSGLCVLSLNEKPGVLSARYSIKENNNCKNLDSKNNKFLIKQLENISDRRAYYICTIVMVRYLNDPNPIIVNGYLNGLIIDKPMGNNGFGYDPHFFVKKFNKTIASMTLDEKNKISHRCKALNKLLKILKRNYLYND
ncbi:Non-canonical purine NTP pyrophosphatase [Candidatus Kinetoplastibacterium sorsogonicusi]|uniref:dITP/XTP pyrophosphatase n=1 Tax=Candidatus Kinetoplastidibacterium kentomonadis TaxID=1576550 RepID=A0A3Q8ERC5_9PROT|nr:RdgB/HAM1 family non-canonical purine NTP pyrophosphatase [Candidatus Kinetoplastibacterium sorsogonicusi]AWD32457.1 Non-canonical purine NTP pyrophosphatase [Candidatus Kinetoplastibacterium sorsogonicusi]